MYTNLSDYELQIIKHGMEAIANGKFCDDYYVDLPDGTKRHLGKHEIVSVYNRVKKLFADANDEDTKPQSPSDEYSVDLHRYFEETVDDVYDMRNFQIALSEISEHVKTHLHQRWIDLCNQADDIRKKLNEKQKANERQLVITHLENQLEELRQHIELIKNEQNK